MHFFQIFVLFSASEAADAMIFLDLVPTSKTYSVGARVVCPVQMRVESRVVTLARHSLRGLMNVMVSISGCLKYQLHFDCMNSGTCGILTCTRACPAGS